MRPGVVIMRCRVEAVIQARGGCTRYWTLNNRCRQVIHKWRFESDIVIKYSLSPPVRHQMSCCHSCCHSRCNAASNWRIFCTGGSRACIRRPNMSQICSMWFKSGLMADQGTEVTASLWLFWSREYNSAKEICKYASFSKVGGNYPLDLKIIWSSATILREEHNTL
jgi:hypothetical protein